MRNSKLEYIDEFSSYVKPILEPKLSSFCTNLTGIKQDKVDNAELFETVYKNHFRWLQTHTQYNPEVYIVTCGGWDFDVMLPKEIKNKKLQHYSLYKRYIDIKSEFENFIYNSIMSFLFVIFKCNRIFNKFVS